MPRYQVDISERFIIEAENIALAKKVAKRLRVIGQAAGWSSLGPHDSHRYRITADDSPRRFTMRRIDG